MNFVPMMWTKVRSCGADSIAGVELDAVLVASLGAVPIASISVDVGSVDVEEFSLASEDVAST